MMSWWSPKRNRDSTTEIRPRTSELSHCLEGGWRVCACLSRGQLHIPLSSCGFIVVSYDLLLASFFSSALLALPIFLLFFFFFSPPHDSSWSHLLQMICSEDKSIILGKGWPQKGLTDAAQRRPAPSAVVVVIPGKNQPYLGLMSCQKPVAVPRLPGRLLLWGLSVAGEDGASNPFLQPAGSCESRSQGISGVLWEPAGPASVPPRATIQESAVGSWRAQQVCL